MLGAIPCDHTGSHSPVRGRCEPRIAYMCTCSCAPPVSSRHLVSIASDSRAPPTTSRVYVPRPPHGVSRPHVHLTCTPHMYTSHVHVTCTPHMYTSHVHLTCTRHMYTSHVHLTWSIGSSPPRCTRWPVAPGYRSANRRCSTLPRPPPPPPTPSQPTYGSR